VRYNKIMTDTGKAADAAADREGEEMNSNNKREKDDNVLYVVTGAAGHLGGTLVRMLTESGKHVRAFIMPQEKGEDNGLVRYFRGDVRQPDTMRPLFEDVGEQKIIFIHAAGIVDISDEVSKLMYDVNVGGTKNVIRLCGEYGVKRLVYVSSVHAIPESGHFGVITETNSFSPDKVIGGYAKTKAEATAAVLEAAENGLDAVVVHPSGILGPYDSGGNHLVQLVRDFIHGKLPACVRGGYDFVDVRDVAQGCLSAAENGRAGRCYILSNRHYDISEMLDMVRSFVGGRHVPALPKWVAEACVPFIDAAAKLKHARPLFTRYSLYTLGSNDRFSHDRATLELGYRPRDLLATLYDTVMWLRCGGTGAGAQV
jgi:dihydroflavonol-4-reductase